MPPYRLGCVVYHPKVERIWSDFDAWFSDQDFKLEVTLFEDYDSQVAALLGGDLDAAWNTNLAYVEVLAATGGQARAIAMRDTDIDWVSHLVVMNESPARSLDDLRGKRIGFGDADSPQAQILPVHYLAAAGLDPAQDVLAERLDRDVGKHGDTGGAELAQLARLRAGELEASVVSGPMLEAIAKLGDAEGLRIVWTSPRYHHCNFTILPGSTADHDRFTELLLTMDASDPQLCDAMELEAVNRWIVADPSGYDDLVEAVASGPVLVGA